MNINVETKSTLVKVRWDTDIGQWKIVVTTWKATLEFSKPANIDELIWFVLDILNDLEIDKEEIQEVEELLMIWVQL